MFLLQVEGDFYRKFGQYNDTFRTNRRLARVRKGRFRLFERFNEFKGAACDLKENHMKLGVPAEFERTV